MKIFSWKGIANIFEQVFNENIFMKRYWKYFWAVFDENISKKFLTDLEGYLQSIVDRFEIDHKVEIDKSGIKDASVSFNFTNVRFGISLGYSF